ncbi:ABC transporter ATP-binding protein [uncultured Sphaerochaeta sp.]|uniref:ABC transporter ATP-binding protein n=1 Tax=uncultured Sphaerochaeta sp. TaxID=886478 RepID=UPI002A0A3AFB|nr:ABC transporter ATP-binding protein [uncultured Sphaerochaeta sp.]
MNDIVVVKNLGFTYRSWDGKLNKPVLENLDCTFQAKSKTLLLAPFDGGKSTFARILGGLCPKYIQGTLSGKLLVNGKDLSVTDPWDLLLDCGYVSQDPQEQFIATTVEDEIAFPLESLGLSRESISKRVDQVLDTWDLIPMRGASEQELSGGERKRVLLAVLEAVNPTFWILDESFDDLDIQWRSLLAEKIKEDSHTVLVLASRYLAQFEGLFDHYALLEQGKLRFGEKQEILQAFSFLCGDDLPNPLDTQIVRISHSQTLACSNLKTIRTRVSSIDVVPFTLFVPSFSLVSGDLATLVGPNGSGKSTFSRLLCGLDIPVEGTFTLDGILQTAKGLNRTVGYLFQNPDLQIFLPTVREELAWSLKRIKNLSALEIEQKVSDCAVLFELELDDTPSTMSYPLRKALQAAVYYLLDRPFYILDELDNALTYATALKIIARLRRNGAGLLLITHDQKFASLLSHTTFAIKDGRLERQ